MSNLAWTNETRLLSQLIPWPRNPRQIKTHEARRLQESFVEFGQPEVIAIGPGNEVYNGHQRLTSWAAKFGDITVDVRVSSRALTEKEREKLTVFLHRGAVGEWNFDVLSEWDVDDLVEWGFNAWELGLDADNDPEAEWKGMPEFENEDVFGAVATVKVHFARQEDIAKFAGLVAQTVNENTKYIWYPHQAKENLKAYHVADNES